MRNLIRCSISWCVTTAFSHWVSEHSNVGITFHKTFVATSYDLYTVWWVKLVYWSTKHVPVGGFKIKSLKMMNDSESIWVRRWWLSRQLKITKPFENSVTYACIINVSFNYTYIKYKLKFRYLIKIQGIYLNR